MADIQNLLNQLKSGDSKERHDAYIGIVALPSLPEDAIKALRELTQDSDDSVAQTAQTALRVHTNRKQASINASKSRLYKLNESYTKTGSILSRRWGIILIVAAIVLASGAAYSYKFPCSDDVYYQFVNAAGKTIYSPTPSGPWLDEPPNQCNYLNKLGLVVGFDSTDRCQGYEKDSIGRFVESGRAKSLACQTIYPFWGMVLLGAVLFIRGQSSKKK